MEKLQSVCIADCFESPTNPRGSKFEGAEFDELVASITEKGVLMPVLAREEKKGKYEVIAGNRRLRAAKKAGLLEIPARIVEMTDVEVREAQIVENLQRSDISPIDEALAYNALIKASKGLDVEGVAAKVGKSQSYIRLRIALLSLDDKYAEKVRSGELPVAHAQLIARLPQPEQAEAYTIAIDQWDGSIRPLSELREHVQGVAFREAMKSPPWKDDEAAKAEIARVTGITGGGKTLFGDKTADKFDDPTEYSRALAAFLKITADTYAADGKKLSLISDEYERQPKGSKVLNRQKYDLVSTVKGCKSGHDGLYIDGEKAGKTTRICTDKTCAAHHPVQKKPSGAAGQTEADKKKQEQQEKREAERRAKEAAAFVAAIGKVKLPLSETQIDVLFGLAADSSRYELGKIGELFSLSPKMTKRSWGNETDYKDAIKKHFGATSATKMQLVFAIALHDAWPETARNKLLKRL